MTMAEAVFADTASAIVTPTLLAKLAANNTLLAKLAANNFALLPNDVGRQSGVNLAWHYRGAC